MARELFEEYFDTPVRERATKNNPFPLVTYREGEQENYTYRRFVRRLVNLGVPEKTHNSVRDMMWKMPLSEVEELLEVAEEMAIAENKRMEDLLAQGEETNERIGELVGTLEQRNKNL